LMRSGNTFFSTVNTNPRTNDPRKNQEFGIIVVGKSQNKYRFF
jgi:hypothetical protein